LNVLEFCLEGQDAHPVFARASLAGPATEECMYEECMYEELPLATLGE